MMKGMVSLIGAGPGDPELLTVKAARRLREADLVLHDALVPAAVIALAGRARAFDVGKRARRKSTPQEIIHRIMIHAALRGERVARLKGGDPFVLGRGGEEALALAAAGIPFEVIPGVSSAIAAPALAGIPVTHRGITSGFLVVSGHSPDSYRSILAGTLPNSVTVVVLMGVTHRRALAEFLIHQGWRSDTPRGTRARRVDPRGVHLGEPSRRDRPGFHSCRPTPQARSSSETWSLWRTAFPSRSTCTRL